MRYITTYHIDYLEQPNGVGTLPATAKRYSGGGLGFKNYEAARNMAERGETSYRCKCVFAQAVGSEAELFRNCGPSDASQSPPVRKPSPRFRPSIRHPPQ